MRNITLAPFQHHHATELWEWMNQFPENNFDDYGPKDERELRQNLRYRMAHGEDISEVLLDGEPVGVISSCGVMPGVVMFRGICFTHQVHGSGVPATAVHLYLDGLFSSGVHKVQAFYFSENAQVHKFLKKLGAVQEGLLREQTMKRSKLTDMIAVAIFSPNSASAIRYRTDQEGA